MPEEVHSQVSIAQAKKNIRSRQSSIIMWLAGFGIALVALQNIVTVLYYPPIALQVYILTVVSVLVCAVFLVNSYVLVGFKRSIYIYCLLDNFVMTIIATIISFIILVQYISLNQTWQLSHIFSFSIKLFLLVGNFKVCLRYSIWTTFRVILTKLLLLFGALSSFWLGLSVIKMQSEAMLDLSTVQEIIVLYVIAIFTLFVEMYAKLSDFDGTSEIKYTYKIKDLETQNSNDERKITKIDQMDNYSQSFVEFKPKMETQQKSQVRLNQLKKIPNSRAKRLK